MDPHVFARFEKLHFEIYLDFLEYISEEEFFEFIPEEEHAEDSLPYPRARNRLQIEN